MERWQRWLQQRERFPHALLLVGAPSQRRMAAMQMAQALLCHTPQQGLACGACRACQLGGHDTHPDLQVWGEAPAIDDIRDIIAWSAQTPHQGERQVIILNEIDTISVSAANAILKTLEEPTESTVFLLGTSRVARVLPTIVSRCVRLVLPQVLGEFPENYPWLLSELSAEDAPDKLASWAADEPTEALY